VDEKKLDGKSSCFNPNERKTANWSLPIVF
jgi:hypothetical protein